MIHIIPNDNKSVVVYRGKVSYPVPSEPGDPAVLVDGQRVPYEDLDAWYRERMLFDWRGQPFDIDRYIDGRVLGGYVGRDFDWADQSGLDGSRYAGWVCDLPEREIGNVRIEKTDILEDWRYRQTFKADPPYDLFRHVRPATDQEWIKE